MSKRAHLHRKIHLLGKNKQGKKWNIFIIVLILLILSIWFCFHLINQKVTPVLMNYAELEAQKLASIIINRAISKQVTEELDIDNLFIVTKDSTGEIKTIDFNPIFVNKVLTLVTNSVQMNLKYLEQGNLELLELPDNVLIDYDKDKLKKGIIYEIPSGVIFNNSFLSNLGPKIPVKLDLVGDIVSGVNTKVTNYGINNALVEVTINLTVSEQVILPFTSKRMTISTTVPVAMKLIQGTVPNYYFNGMDKNSGTLSIPIQ